MLMQFYNKQKKNPGRRAPVGTIICHTQAKVVKLLSIKNFQTKFFSPSREEFTFSAIVQFLFPNPRWFRREPPSDHPCR